MATTEDASVALNGLGDPAGTGSPVKPRLTPAKAAMTTAFWFGYNVCMYTYLVLLLPDQAAAIAGDDNKGTALAIISGVSGAVNLFVAVYFGAFNDMMRGWPKIGRRKPWIALGTVAECILLFGLTGNQSLGVAVVINTLFIVSTIFCSSAWYGLVADVAPNDQFHLMSAFQGGAAILGNLVGAVLGAFLSTSTARIAMVVLFLVCSTVTCLVHEPPYEVRGDTVADVLSSPRKLYRLAFVEPFIPMRRNKAFFLVFLSRFFFQLGINTVIQLFQYWLTDCIALPSSMSNSMATNVALVPVLIIGPIAAFILTHGTFQYRRKLVVYFSGLMFLVVVVVVWLTTTYAVAVAVACIFGLGYGPFFSVEFAMALDSLTTEGNTGDKPLPVVVAKTPSYATEATAVASEASQENYARDLSIWHNALVLPSIFSTPLAGVLRDVFQPIGRDIGVQCFGYKIDFLFIGVYIIAGMITTHFIPRMH